MSLEKTKSTALFAPPNILSLNNIFAGANTIIRLRYAVPPYFGLITALVPRRLSVVSLVFIQYAQMIFSSMQFWRKSNLSRIRVMRHVYSSYYGIP